MNSTDYKKYHESFMQNNHGSSAVHTFCCIFFTVLCSIISGLKVKKSGVLRYANEYIFVVLPMIAAHTFLSGYIYCLNIFVIIILIFELVKNKFHVSLLKPNVFKTKTIKSISYMRALTYLITVFSILAVDFRDFPRYLAKTENYGYSLMDTGVGLFALMSGLVHKDIKNENFITIAKSNAKFVAILTVLGTVRYVSIKQLDYHEHVTEYGVHWNFFYTLAVCKLISTSLLYITNRPFLFSFLTIVIHELILYCSLQEWVFSDLPRNDLLSANREGLSSSLGYVSLYLFAAHIKTIISDKTVYRITVLNKLVTSAITLSFLTFCVNIHLPASRALANAAYCLYLEAVLCIVLTLIYLIEVSSQNEDSKFNFDIPVILESINTNGLSYFLISNIMTGAVNMSMQTMFASSCITFIVLNVYMILNIAFAVFMKSKGFRI